MDKYQSELLRRARGFDLQALAEIYDFLKVNIYAFAFGLLCDQNSIEKK